MSADYVVLTATMVGLVVGLFLILHDGPESVSQSVGTSLANARVVELGEIN